MNHIHFSIHSLLVTPLLGHMCQYDMSYSFVILRIPPNPNDPTLRPARTSSKTRDTSPLHPAIASSSSKRNAAVNQVGGEKPKLELKLELKTETGTRLEAAFWQMCQGVSSTRSLYRVSWTCFGGRDGVGGSSLRVLISGALVCVALDLGHQDIIFLFGSSWCLVSFLR